jgi:hypothetical protein
LLCFIVVPPCALRSSSLTNLILIVAVELYLKRLLQAILATACRVLHNPHVLLRGCNPWPKFVGGRQILAQFTPSAEVCFLALRARS